MMALSENSHSNCVILCTKIGQRILQCIINPGREVVNIIYKEEMGSDSLIIGTFLLKINATLVETE